MCFKRYATLNLFAFNYLHFVQLCENNMGKRRTLFLLLLAAVLFKKSQPLPRNKKDIRFCNSHSYFSSEQKEFCLQNTDLVKVLQSGYQLGHKLCQKAFQSGKGGTRWNCTNMVASNKKNVFFNVPYAKGKS